MSAGRSVEELVGAIRQIAVTPLPHTPGGSRAKESPEDTTAWLFEEGERPHLRDAPRCLSP